MYARCTVQGDRSVTRQGVSIPWASYSATYDARRPRLFVAKSVTKSVISHNGTQHSLPTAARPAQ
eukprot:5971704-Pyramimonas_sp.AAC.2